MTELKTIEIKIYRGKSEPILEQRQCKIILYDKHLEYIYDYDYESENGKTENLICATVIPKNQISLDLTQGTSENDPDHEAVPLLLIKSISYTERVYMENMEKAEKLYSVIKRWLIS